jgi:hypothetical protein
MRHLFFPQKMSLQYFGHLVLHEQRCPKKPSGHKQAPLSFSHDLQQPCGTVMNTLFCDVLFCNEYKRTLLISKVFYLQVTKEGFAKQRGMCVPEVEPFQRVFSTIQIHYILARTI